MNEQQRSPQIGSSGFFVFLVCVVVLLILAGLLNWSVHRSSRVNPALACINNLRQIDAAACEFALEKHLTNGTPINFPNDLTPYIKLNSAGKIPGCPQGGIYNISKVGDTPTCTMSTLTPAHVLP
jgi:hypothetical protein